MSESSTQVDEDDAVRSNPVEEDDEGNDDEEESNYRDPPIGFIRLRPSKFLNIPATVYIEYPPELGIHRNDENILEPIGSKKLQYSLYWERICVRNAFHRAGFTKNSKVWTAMWSKHQNQEQMRELNCLQKINHFPNSWCVGRKDRLLRTLNVMKRIHGSAYDFHPEGYILPTEREAFLRQARGDVQSSKCRVQISSKTKVPSEIVDRNDEAGTGKGTRRGSRATDDSPLWIMKPVAASCGRGIRVISSLQALCSIPKSRKVILQRYMDAPYLINGHKFDLRIYVLVTGVDPLRVYVHDEGLTRLATAKYGTTNTANRFAHLTNYSVNKKSKKFTAAAMNEDQNVSDGEMEGYKWSLKAFRSWLAQQEGQQTMERVFRSIHDICVKTMLAAESDITPSLHACVSNNNMFDHLAANYRSNCYELFGCDILLTRTLEPVLLEVNVSPSLMGSSPMDKRIKGILLADALHLVGLYPHDSKLLRKYHTVDKDGSTIVSSASSSSGGHTNPFEFGCVSRMLNSQDRWRRTPHPDNIDFGALGQDESTWLMVLMAEDEITRSKTTRFHLVHPTPSLGIHYSQLYRINRFSDHLLAKWVASGGSNGKLKKFIPSRFLRSNGGMEIKGSCRKASKKYSPVEDAILSNDHLLVEEGPCPDRIVGVIADEDAEYELPDESNKLTKQLNLDSEFCRKILNDDSARVPEKVLGSDSATLTSIHESPENLSSGKHNPGSNGTQVP